MFAAPSSLHAAPISLNGDLPPLETFVLTEIGYPTRLARGPDHKLYVSDARANTVYVYDAEPNLVKQLKDIKRPLGLAVAPTGDV